jgi:hypothetical protein
LASSQNLVSLDPKYPVIRSKKLGVLGGSALKNTVLAIVLF